MTRHKLTIQQLTVQLFEYAPWPSISTREGDLNAGGHLRRLSAQMLANYNKLHAHPSIQLLLPVHDRTVLMTTEEIEKHICICDDMIMLGTKRLMEL